MDRANIGQMLNLLENEMGTEKKEGQEKEKFIDIVLDQTVMYLELRGEDVSKDPDPFWREEKRKRDERIKIREEETIHINGN